MTKVTFLSLLDVQSTDALTSSTSISISVLLIACSLIAILYSVRTKNYRLIRHDEQALGDIFAKITYELRTPLTVILGISKQLRVQKDLSNGNLNTYLNAIDRQGKNLSELVNQLIDVADLSQSAKDTPWETGNVAALVEMTFETFRIPAQQRDIELFYFSEDKKIEAQFVPDYLNKILHNLLSNAIKYSDEGSRINLILERSKNNCNNFCIKVIDHGQGIPEDDLGNIFEFFYTSPNTNKEGNNSSGVGLAITKRLTETMGGTISVESQVGKGTTFAVELPVQQNGKHSITHTTVRKHEQVAAQATDANETTQTDSESTLPEELRTTILLAEDNRDIAFYIQSIFPAWKYKTIYASNGEKAWKLINEQLPDIIITDAHMPKICGIQLCKQIKSSPLLNHIPVVMISAKNGHNELIDGLKSGADSYIRKPFGPEELQVTVDNLLASRQLLKEKYGRAVIREEQAEANDLKGINGEFLRHATDIIYREMKNPDFTPGIMAEELAISVSHLNKKLNSLTGYPSSSYILQVKLRHAKKLFNSKEMTIGEVAAECGIYDVNYFSRIFKKYTGITPTQYKRLPQNQIGK